MTPTAQFEFDGLFEFGQQKQRLTVQEVGLSMGISDEQVRALLDAGLLVAVPINDRDHGIGRDGRPAPRREHVRIERWSAVGYWRHLQEARGIQVPFKLTPQAAWWRDQLKGRKA